MDASNAPILLGDAVGGYLPSSTALPPAGHRRSAGRSPASLGFH